MSNNNLTTTQRNQNTEIARPEQNRVMVAPAVDIFENDDEILLLADLPGVPPDAIKIRVERGELSFEARRTGEPTGGRLLGGDAGLFDYGRRFQVPGGIDGSRISARMDNGVLHLHLPKAEESKPREIHIKAR